VLPRCHPVQVPLQRVDLTYSTDGRLSHLSQRQGLDSVNLPFVMIG
jgi:hypothetical protein